MFLTSAFGGQIERSRHLKSQAMIKLRVQNVLDTYDAGVEVIGAYFQEISPPVEVS